MRFENRVAIVTGGANGIGRAVVEKLVEEGARVAVWDLAVEVGAALQEEISARGGQVHLQHVNVADAQSVENAIQELVAHWKRVDILVNSAGIVRDAQLVKAQDGEVLSRMSVEDFDAVINVNLRGVFLCTRAVVPVMIRQRYGRIVNPSSVVAEYGNFGQTNYVAAKAGIVGMTRVWARELGRYNIAVNAIAPGFIETDMTRQMPPKVLEMMIHRTPLRRLGKPHEIAEAIVFLASDQASFISGAVLAVDGGMVVGT